MQKNKFLVIGTGLIILVVIIFVVFFFFQGVNVITDRKEYPAGDNLRVNIKNNSRKNICFSSCYPYYLEKKGENWESYPYGDCPEVNLVENCVKSGQIKAFELELPVFLGAGLHRLTIPACIGCSLRQTFLEEERFYSNDFIVK